MGILAVIALLALFFYYEYTRIRRFDGGRGEVLALTTTMIIAFAFALAIVLDVAIPSPTDVINKYLGAIGEMIVPPSR